MIILTDIPGLFDCLYPGFAITLRFCSQFVEALTVPSEGDGEAVLMLENDLKKKKLLLTSHI